MKERIFKIAKKTSETKQITIYELMNLFDDTREKIFDFATEAGKGQKRFIFNYRQLKELNKLTIKWHDTKINIDKLMSMKNNHKYINGKINDKKLNKLWNQYIDSGLNLRVCLMEYNYINKRDTFFNTVNRRLIIS
jgi:hypothetical protein